MIENEHSEFEIALERTPAPMPEVSPEARLIEALRESGANLPDVQVAYAVIQRAFDEAGDRRAADALAVILARLPGGKHGDELRAAMNLALGCDGVELANKYGESKQGWQQRVERLRRRIFQKTLTASP